MRRSYGRLNSQGAGGGSQSSKENEKTLDSRKLWRNSCISILIILAVIFIAGVLIPDYKSSELRFVAIVHRHGARTALWKYTFEEGEIEWKLDLGKLTQHGMQQGFEAGQKFKKEYWKLLSSTTDDPHEKMEVFSTDFDRTVDTANSMMLGLFSDSGTGTDLVKGNCSCRPERGTRSEVQCVGKCLGLSELPANVPEVQLLDEEHMPLLLQFEECKGWVEEVDRLKNTSFKTAAKNQFKSQIELVEKIVGGSEVCMSDNKENCQPITLDILEKVWNNAVCAEDSGQAYPGGMDYKDFQPKLLEAVTWMWHQKYAYEYGPITGGMLVGNIIDRFQQKISEDINKSENQGALMVTFSGHDSTVAALLDALGAKNWPYPDFVSHIVIELRCFRKGHKDSYEVILSHDDQPLEIGVHGSRWLFDDFVEAMHARRKDLEECERGEAR